MSVYVLLNLLKQLGKRFCGAPCFIGPDLDPSRRHNFQMTLEYLIEESTKNIQSFFFSSVHLMLY